MFLAFRQLSPHQSEASQGPINIHLKKNAQPLPPKPVLTAYRFQHIYSWKK